MATELLATLTNGDGVSRESRRITGQLTCTTLGERREQNDIRKQEENV